MDMDTKRFLAGRLGEAPERAGYVVTVSEDLAQTLPDARRHSQFQLILVRILEPLGCAG